MHMIDFEINMADGKVKLDNKDLLIQREDEFIVSEPYKYLESINKVQRLIPYYYTVNAVLWFSKEFELIVRP
ncbi:TPA: hypothetical protein O8U27_004759, partial [Enterobacter cloacae]|nr:hypothetical protein [Enterobacter cloacae]